MKHWKQHDVNYCDVELGRRITEAVDLLHYKMHNIVVTSLIWHVASLGLYFGPDWLPPRGRSHLVTADLSVDIL